MRKYYVLALLGSTSILVPADAQAEQAQSGATASADVTAINSGPLSADIIVTATRRAESLQDVPLAVDVVSGADLRKLNLFDFKDVQALSPGLQLTNNDGRSNVATLRGITFDPDAGAPPAVDVFINEVPIDIQTAFTAIYDVGQIEILRGPQGIFRGRTSPAGAITLKTKRPDMNSPEGYAQATLTDRRSFNFQTGLSVPIIQDVLAIRGAMLIDANRSNQVRHIDGTRSRGDTESARITLGFTPSPNFEAYLTYQYLTSDVRPYVAVFGDGNQPSLLDPSRSGPAISLDDRLSVTEGVPRFQNRTNLITLEATYNMGWANLSFNGGYQKTLLLQSRDQDATNAIPNQTQMQTVVNPYETITGDLRLTSDGDGPFSWNLGATYSHMRNDVVVNQVADVFSGLTSTPLPADTGRFPVDVVVGVPVVSDIYSVTGSLGYELTPALKLEVGARYNWSETSRQSFLTVVLPSLGVTQLENYPTIANPQQNFKAVTGGASLTWEVTPDFTTYASYGRSFRPGTVAVGVSTPLDGDILSTPKETSDAGELGVKASLFDRRLSVNIAAFYQRFKNYIGYEANLTTNVTRLLGQVDAAPTPLPSFGDASSRGIEAQVMARMTDNFDLSVNASYADAHYDDAQIYCNDYNGDGIPDSDGVPSVPEGQQVAVCARNDRLSQIAKFNLSATGELRFGSDGTVPFVRGLVNYRPGFNSTLDRYQYRNFANISVFAGVRGPDSRWEMTAFVKNLLNQTRATRVSQGVGQYPTTGLDDNFEPTGMAGAPFVSGYRTAVISAPREIGLTLNFNW